MKFITVCLLNMLVSFIACIYFPWWSIAIVAFLLAIIIYQKPFLNLLSGFLAIFILWAVMAAIISNNNHNILAHKVSLLILKTDNPMILIILTGLIGGIVAGLAALCGSYCNSIMVAKSDNSVG